MDASYEIWPESGSNIVHVVMRGFFDAKDVAVFTARYRDVLATLPRPGHLTLADITGMKIQTQDIVSAFSAFMAQSDVQSRKLAFVCGTGLARLQATRLTSREGVAFFDNEADARHWLLA